jgi:hypothetical protein
LYDSKLKELVLDISELNINELIFDIMLFDNLLTEKLDVNNDNLKKLFQNYSNYFIFQFSDTNHPKLDYILKIGNWVFFVQNTIAKLKKTEKNRFYFIIERILYYLILF